MHISEDRHPGTRHFEPLFRYDHLPAHLQAVSKPIPDVAQHMIDTLTDGPELTEGLRKLWEAKNSLVVHAGFCQDQQVRTNDDPGCAECGATEPTVHVRMDRMETRCGNCNRVLP